MGKKTKKTPTNLITIYVYNKKQLAQAQSMGEGYFCSAYKKKMKLKLQIAFYPSQIHDSTDYCSQLSTIAMLPFFFSLELLHLVESREKGAKEECTSWEV